MKITPELYTKAYTRGIQSTLKGLATDGSDLHENYTPTVICDMMLDKLDLTQPKSILILYNLELLFALRLRKYTGPVTFFTQSPTKAEIAPKFLPGVAVEYIDKEENPLYHMETKWPEKFDIVIANPPYSNNLHIKFLEKSIEISKDEIIFVHPASSYLHGNKKYDEINSFIKENIKSLSFFNGNPIFNIGLYVPCVITHLSKLHKSKTFQFTDSINDQNLNLEKSDLNKISLFGYHKHFNSIKDKMLGEIKKTGTVHENCFIKSRGSKNHQLVNRDSYFVEFTRIRGNTNMNELSKKTLYKDDFFTLFKSDITIKQNTAPIFNIWAEFDCYEKAENFIKYCKTDFARMCLALGKTSQSLDCGPLKYIPWMDFTQEWTDEKLYAHFNITGEEQAFIKEVIPPYYD